MMWVWVKTMEKKEILKKVEDRKGKVAAVGGRRKRDKP